MLENCHIRYDEGETGWAEVLGEGKYRICNIPLTDLLNIDDVVTCAEGDDGWLEVVDVLERKYPSKTAIKYDTVEQYKGICERATEAGFKVEGMVGPHHGKPGICFVAHDENLNVYEMIKKAGVETPQAWDNSDD